MTAAACILVVSDEPVALRTLSAQLAARGYLVVTAASADETSARTAASKPDLVTSVYTLFIYPALPFTSGFMRAL